LPNKPFLKLGNETLIQRQVRLIKELGINNIKIVAGQNKQKIQEIFKDGIEFMDTGTDHKNCLYELAGICKVTKEEECMLVLLGDLVFSKLALKEMLAPVDIDITVYGSGDYKWYELNRAVDWRNRGGEIFAVKLQHGYIRLGWNLLKAMPDLHYQLKNIPKQLKLPIHAIKECFDIDQPPDYNYALSIMCKIGRS
jgi:choline kinase